jgi:4a-hydroxytetrahydrobiopterin dehydratase
MKLTKATDEEIAATLSELPGWSIKNGKLHKQYEFASFSKAIGWIVTAAIEVEKMDHHPEWFNVYNQVIVDLVTHDLGDAISTTDLALARRLEALSDS